MTGPLDAVPAVYRPSPPAGPPPRKVTPTPAVLTHGFTDPAGSRTGPGAGKGQP